MSKKNTQGFLDTTTGGDHDSHSYKKSFGEQLKIASRKMNLNDSIYMAHKMNKDLYGPASTSQVDHRRFNLKKLGNFSYTQKNSPARSRAFKDYIQQMESSSMIPK